MINTNLTGWLIFTGIAVILIIIGSILTHLYFENKTSENALDHAFNFFMIGLFFILVGLVVFTFF